MTLLRDVRPEEFLRAGAVFGEVAEQIGKGVGQVRRSAEVRWVGRPNQQYQKKLSGLARDLTRIQRAYDEACDVLISYSRALVPVRELALQADLLAAQAEDLHQGRNLDLGMNIFYAPITPAEQALIARARLLRDEAEHLERLASARLVARLDALADDAPHLSGWTWWSRGVADTARGATDQLVGTARVAGAAFSSLPLVGDAQSRSDARRELWSAASAMAQPWLAVEELLQDVREGRYGYAGGSLAGALVLRSHGARGRKVELFGAHDDMHVGVLIGLKRGGFEDALAAEQWVAGRAQRELLEALLRLQHVPLPDVERLVAEGADLLLQEVHGGHTLLRHIARDPAFLRLRQLAERGPDGPMTMSSFADIDEAERVVAQALADSAGPLRAWVEGAESDLRLDVPLRAAAGIVVDARGAVVLAQRAVVWLVRLRNGSIRLNTAYLDVDPE